jgi:hypothetical protein
MEYAAARRVGLGTLLMEAVAQIERRLEVSEKVNGHGAPSRQSVRTR